MIAYEEPSRFSYTLLSGLPVRDHVGTVELTANGGGTKMVYAVRTSRPCWLSAAPSSPWSKSKRLRALSTESSRSPSGALLPGGSAVRPLGEPLGDSSYHDRLAA